MINKKQNEKTLVLLDAHAILHRAYHALPNFSSSRGEATGALYGLSTMLMKIVNDFKPHYIVACFDVPEPTYRHDAYDEYKAGRAKTDNELISQIIKAKEVFSAFSVPVYEKAGFEADDILGTIVEQTKKDKNLKIIIASGDMDTMQLVDKDKVSVYTLKKGIKETVLYNEDRMKERFGFPPDLLPDFKGLSGDPSDNIPGVRGIGEKTATALIQKIGSVEKIIKTAKEKPEKLEGVGIKPRIINLLTENEEEAIFSKMLATIRRDVPINFSLPNKNWKEEVDVSKISELFSMLEFRSLNQRLRETVEGDTTKEDIVKKEAKDFSKLNISDEELEKQKIATWLIDSNRTDPSNDDVLQIAGVQNIDQAPTALQKRLKDDGLLELYKKIELPLIPVVQSMSDRGISIDIDSLKVLLKEYKKDLNNLQKKIYSSAGREFNINSPKQLGQVLFDELGLSSKNQKKTAGGARSTRESELEKLKDQHPVIEKILEYRGLAKLVSTYLEPILEMVSEKNRLHARFVQTGTTTGRMSSEHPNLQNIPIRSPEGNRIRKIFRATEGFTLVAFDYSQIELRIAAILSGDSKLVEIFHSQGDVHQGVASEVFGVSPNEVTKEMRRKAKIINFGILYGMGVNALKDNLGSTQSEAREFLSLYFSRFPELRDYMENVKKEAAQDGYTTTMFGRRRYFSGIHSPIPYIRASAERMAINAPIQGTEADIIKKAMVEVDIFLQKEGELKNVFPLLQVHDELVYEIKNEKIETLLPEIRRIMEEALAGKDAKGVPITVEVEIGLNWKEMNKYEN